MLILSPAVLGKMKSLPTSIQELGPKQARLCLEVEKFGNRKCAAGFASHTMLVGVSGGIDSTALLIIATLLARKSGGRVFCAHVDHGLRDESSGDAEFVSELCENLGVTLKSVRVDVKGYSRRESIGLEEAGRILRYDFFREYLDSINGNFLLLAHHLNDLSEDVVMRLIRGSGWPALSGMNAYDPERRLLRPLLSTPKADLQDFLEAIECPWREDESNQSDFYTRNRIRNRIMPLLLEENPSFGSGIIRLKNQAELDEDFWAQEINTALSGLKYTDSGEIMLDCSLLNKRHPALRLRIYKAILDSMGKGHSLAESLLRLDQAFQDRKYGSIFQFPGSKRVSINKNGLLFKVIKIIDSEGGKV